MNELYAMQRANGDWFAVEDRKRLRLPVFRSCADAMTARSRDSGMECFRPVKLDERSILSMDPHGGTDLVFWLVKDPSVNLKRGQRLDFAEFNRLINDDSDRR